MIKKENPRREKIAIKKDYKRLALDWACLFLSQGIKERKRAQSKASIAFIITVGPIEEEARALCCERYAFDCSPNTMCPGRAFFYLGPSLVIIKTKGTRDG
jgi:hypothetical protein